MSQHFSYRLRRLFKYDDDMSEPIFRDYILFIGRKPYEQKCVERENGNAGFSYISKYQWTVILDLWVVAMRFRWIGRERDAKA